MTTTIPNYEISDRTRFRLLVPAGACGAPRTNLLPPPDTLDNPAAQLQALQAAYLGLRKVPAVDRARILPGLIYDEMGQHVATIGPDGSLWDASYGRPRASFLRPAPGEEVPAGWINTGDISPSGARLFRFDEAELSERSFTIPCVDVTPECNVGGSEHVYLLRSGTVFLARTDFQSALDTIGAKLSGEELVVDREMASGPRRIAIRSREGLTILSDAAYAYGGIDNVEINSLVSIGLPCHYDQERKFTGETDYYPEGTSLWDVMRDRIDGFDYLAPGREAKPAAPIDYQLLKGMPENLTSRADLMSMQVFRTLDADTAGNPCVWSNEYEHGDCESAELGDNDDPEAPSWTSEWSCGCSDECPDCGAEIEPVRSVWIGPQEQVLRDLWETLPEAEEAPASNYSPAP